MREHKQYVQTQHTYTHRGVRTLRCNEAYHPTHTHARRETDLTVFLVNERASRCIRPGCASALALALARSLQLLASISPRVSSFAARGYVRSCGNAQCKWRTRTRQHNTGVNINTNVNMLQHAFASARARAIVLDFAT